MDTYQQASHYEAVAAAIRGPHIGMSSADAQVSIDYGQMAVVVNTDDNEWIEKRINRDDISHYAPTIAGPAASGQGTRVVLHNIPSPAGDDPERERRRALKAAADRDRRPTMSGDFGG